jgi:Dolichyl-phosphate-mannose-protein mannosyltransferase
MPRRSISPSTRGFYVGLTLISLAALAFRLWYVWSQRGRLTLNGDAFYYHYQANDIAEGRWFIEPGRYAFAGQELPSAGHPPVYLLYLAFFSRLGIDTETGHRIVSTFLGAGGIFVIGLVGRALWNQRAGLLAAAIATGYAHLWINDEMLMSESAYVLTASLMVLLAYRYWQRPTVARAAWMGGGIAIAALSRAEALALFAFLVIPFACSRRFSSWRDRLARLGAAWAVGVALLAPWFVFNLTRFEHPVTMSNGIGSVLMVANCDVWSTPDGLTFEEPSDADGTTAEYVGTFRGQFLGYWSINCSHDLDQQIRDRFDGDKERDLLLELQGDESQREVVWRAIGLDNISENLSELPAAMVTRMARMWDLWFIRQNIDFNASLEGRGAWQSTLATWQYVLMAPFAVAGLVLVRRRRRPVLPILAVAGVITFTAAMTFGITRYRAPIDALIPVLVAITIVHLLERRHTRSA